MGQKDTVCAGKGHISSLLAANHLSGPRKGYHCDFMACIPLEGPGNTLGSLWSWQKSSNSTFWLLYHGVAEKVEEQPRPPCCTSLPAQGCAGHQEDLFGSYPI